MLLFFCYNNNGDNMIELLGEGLIIDDQYEIKKYSTEDGIIQALCKNGCVQSLSFTNKDKINELCNDYFKLFNIPTEICNISNCLLLGGGGFSYPKYYISYFKNKNIDVVELDKDCLEYTKKYNFISEEILSNPYLNIIIGNALDYVKDTKKKYDYILIDLFDGPKPLEEAYSTLYLSQLKSILNDHGVIGANYIVSRHNRKTYLNDIKRCSQVMKYFKILTCAENYNLEKNIGNIFIIMSNEPIKILSKCKYLDITDFIM